MLCWLTEQIYFNKTIIWNFWIVWKYLSSLNYTTDCKVQFLLSADLMRVVCVWSNVTLASDVFYFEGWILELHRQAKKVTLPNFSFLLYIPGFLGFHRSNLMLRSLQLIFICPPHNDSWTIFFPYRLRYLVFISTVIHTSPVKYIWSA